MKKRLLALLLAMVMVFSLAACGDSDDGGEGGKGGSGTNSDRVTPVVKSPKDDAAGYLAMALENTYIELAQRYAGSPLAAILGALDTTGQVSLSGKIDTSDGTVNLKDLSLEYDLDKKVFILSMDAASSGLQLTAGACVSPDFVGVSFPILLGDDDYYGVKPQDLTSQLKGSFLWDTMKDEVSTEDLEQIDEMLDILWDTQIFDLEALKSGIQDIGTDYMKGLDLDYDEDTVELDGKDVDGYVFTATVTSDDLLDMMDQIYDVILDMPIWDTLLKMSELSTGRKITKKELRAMLDESLDEVMDQLADVDLEVEATYYVADGKVVSMESTSKVDTQTVSVSVDFFDDGAITGTIAAQGEKIRFSSEVESKRGSYVHEIRLVSDGETVAITTEWDGEEFSLSAEVPYEDPMSITCGLSTTKKGFTIEDLRVQYDGADVTLPLTMEYTAGGSVSTPRNTNNLLTLNEKELTEIISNVQDLMNGRMLSDF